MAHNARAGRIRVQNRIENLGIAGRRFDIRHQARRITRRLFFIRRHPKIGLQQQERQQQRGEEKPTFYMHGMEEALALSAFTHSLTILSL